MKQAIPVYTSRVSIKAFSSILVYVHTRELYYRNYQNCVNKLITYIFSFTYMYQQNCTIKKKFLESCMFLLNGVGVCVCGGGVTL